MIYNRHVEDNKMEYNDSMNNLIRIPHEEQDTWGAWGKYVLKELERLNHCINEVDNSLEKNRTKHAEDIKGLEHCILDKLKAIESKIISFELNRLDLEKKLNEKLDIETKRLEKEMFNKINKVKEEITNVDKETIKLKQFRLFSVETWKMIIPALIGAAIAMLVKSFLGIGS